MPSLSSKSILNLMGGGFGSFVETFVFDKCTIRCDVGGFDGIEMI